MTTLWHAYRLPRWKSLVFSAVTRVSGEHKAGWRESVLTIPSNLASSDARKEEARHRRHLPGRREHR